MTNGFLEASFVYQKLTIRLFPKMYLNEYGKRQTRITRVAECWIKSDTSMNLKNFFKQFMRGALSECL